MRKEKDLPCPSEEDGSQSRLATRLSVHPAYQQQQYWMVTYLNSIVMPDPEDEDGDESGDMYRICMHGYPIGTCTPPRQGVQNCRTIDHDHRLVFVGGEENEKTRAHDYLKQSSKQA
ncbi:hypothetical protein MGYG_01390 [Nannizzia gypsea CBS 118893]|uniref:Uncharacterized protein n=1 Tax=Arthroderma gypseum (strain ATCC MYA-4604 / CBS 118893) TaxID=535722 RepID=E5R0L5_ARTGP|nr:hypothetical protein MGYG_01390 [Nannizzia gypsea CBS 118893]EFQ98359.1 hypothetical protein MGYG_01390 [Nannizzia gypsea CBS 118893]